MDTVNDAAAGALVSGAAPALAALLSGHVASSQIQISLFTEADEPAPPVRAAREPDLKKLRKRAVQQQGHEQRAQLRALQLERERYNQENHKRIAARDNVDDALETLERKDRQFHRIALAWACIGALSLVMGALYFGSLTFLRPAPGAPLTWEYIAFCLSRGVPALAVLGLLTAYAFKFSMSYLRESLKYADRRHAIHYGKLVLETYGPQLGEPQFRQAFEHWNLSGEGRFPRPPDELGNGPLSIDFTAIAETFARGVRKPEPGPKQA